MSSPTFGRILTALITPFGSDGSVDLDVAQQLARRLVDEGNEGLVVCGTTGESPTLSDDEKLSMFSAVLEAVDVPVIAGTVGNDTAHSVELSLRAKALGVHGILSLCPYYNRPSQTGIEQHLRAIAQAVELPQVIYDIPVRTGRKVSSEVLLRLAHDEKNVIGLKDAAANPAETARVIREAPADFEVYSGDDGLTLPLLSVGAVGTIGVATHWTAPDHVDMFAALESGNLAAATAINQRMLPSFAFETGDLTPNPIPSKAMMRTLGFEVGQCRLPLGDAPAGLEDEARRIYAELVSARG
ncbi:MAG: 4-hydroxy-tetrahydrodipicolinate synthase [Ilumatobacteraceae bacterium]|jgi:4-hydroxy-tetrahydrodipicolinate synthase|tara:strand:- start:373 stop:1269 length:897 start_codon:yes stop_codon:yes gene_type:complete